MTRFSLPLTWLLSGAVCLAAALPAGARADDRVVLQPGGRYSSRISIRGEVLDYTGKELTIRIKVGIADKVYPAGEVVEVATDQTTSHAEGVRQLAEGELPQARQSLEKALTLESRKWVQREILALLIRAALRTGDYASAGTHFARLISSDPTSRHFRLIPLAWMNHDWPTPLEEQALGWMQHERDPVRLMGASFLINHPVHAEAAVTLLGELATCVDRRVQVLAQAQIWRSRPITEVSGPEVARWVVRIEAMPEEVRGGPYFLLGEVYVSRREHELAAMAYLWTPLVYDHDHYLAAQASLRAANALVAVGQRPEAAALYREISQRFAETPYAAEADAARQKLAAPR